MCFNQLGFRIQERKFTTQLVQKVQDKNTIDDNNEPYETPIVISINPIQNNAHW